MCEEIKSSPNFSLCVTKTNTFISIITFTDTGQRWIFLAYLVNLNKCLPLKLCLNSEKKKVVLSRYLAMKNSSLHHLGYCMTGCNLCKPNGNIWSDFNETIRNFWTHCLKMILLFQVFRLQTEQLYRWATVKFVSIWTTVHYHIIAVILRVLKQHQSSL